MAKPGTGQRTTSKKRSRDGGRKSEDGMTQEQKAARAEAKAAKKAAMGTSDEPRQDTTPVRALGQWIERAPTKRDDHGLCITTDGGGES